MVFKIIHIKYLGLFILVCVLVYIFRNYDPSQYSFFPKCAVKSITGLTCPGCGTQRAMYAYLNLDFGAAMSYNPFIPAYLVYFVVFLIWKTPLENKSQGLSFGTLHRWLYGSNVVFTFLTFVLIIFVMRNI